MKKNGTCFAVIDPGSHEMAAVAARWDANGDYRVEAFAKCDARGIRKGIVTDMGTATDSISELLAKLSERTGRAVKEVYAGISSPSINMIASSGMVLLSKYGREVSERDVETCVEAGSTLKMPLDVEPLHKVVKEFQIDGERGIKNPLNLDGVKLGVEMNVVTINSSAVRNMSRCVSEAGYLPSGFVFSGLALAYRILPDEDRERGAVLLDICDDITAALVYNGGILTGCKVFPVGFDDVVMPDGRIDEDKAGMLSSRVTALNGWEKSGRVFITGDGAFNDALMESLERTFNRPVKAGACQIRPFEELPAETIAYAGSIGILDYLQEERRKEKISKSLLRRWYNRATRFVEKYF